MPTGDGPSPKVGVAHLRALRTEMLASGRLLSLHEPGVTGELLNTGKAVNVFYFVEDGHSEYDSNSGHGAQKKEGLSVVELSL